MDKYDVAIQDIKDANHFGDAVYNVWVDPIRHPNGCLFQFVNRELGCLTQIRNHASGSGYYTSDEDYHIPFEVLYEINQDERIPLTTNGINPENIEVFAEWNRRLDQILGEDRTGHPHEDHDLGGEA